jgi:hypothetical protein
MARIRVLTWQVHGAYLESLAHVPVDFYLPVDAQRSTGYGGRGTLALPDTVHEVPVDEVARRQFDVILFQSRENYLKDQHRILSPAQRRLPRVYLEHDSPRRSPTDERHVVEEFDVLLVHCTAFNALMWDSGWTPTRVIEHGVAQPAGVEYQGDLARGIVVFNDLATRGRRVGLDLFEAFREQVPLDLVGLRSEALGGLGPLDRRDLPRFEARYRFLFHPARWTSLGLAVIEAMLVGVPVVAPATTELVTVVEHRRSGIIATDPAELLAGMRELLEDPGMARELGHRGQEIARERFGIERFSRDWLAVFEEVAGRRQSPASGLHEAA